MEPPETGPHSRWRFGVFELDAETSELRRAGLAVRLQPQALQVLVALLERPGRIVSRDQLRQRLWGGTTFVAFDRSLNFCVSSLRRALADDARSPRFVETVPGRGYRFIAPVHGAEDQEIPVREMRAEPGPPVRTRATSAGVAFATLLLLGLSFAPPRPEPRDSAAQALYAEARALCGTAGWRRSVPLFRAALARDPRFAAAHAGLAEAYLALGETASIDPGEALPRAREAAHRALELEDRADARLVLGRVLLEHDWDWSGSEREIRRALALDPSSVPAWVALARVLSVRGDHAGAIRSARRAEALDPAAPEAVEELAWCYYRARRLDEAARQFRLVGERRPEEAHQLLFTLFRQAGRYPEALAEAHALMRRVGVPARDRAALERMPPEAAARAYLRGTVAYLRREASRNHIPPERMALLHAALGESSAAIAWLSAAAEQHSPGLVTALLDPTLDTLRSEPGFVSLVRRVGSPAALKAS
jgi:DNA-binding winged helix-turn-helix (wHTH) protein/tetratricopeptide (TPR) repeat protein